MNWYEKQEAREQTKQAWQPYYKEELTDEDADEISRNLTGFFKILMETDIRRKTEMLESSKIYCNDCNNQIQEVNDFHIYKEKHYCSSCFQNYHEELRNS